MKKNSLIKQLSFKTFSNELFETCPFEVSETLQRTFRAVSPLFFLLIVAKSLMYMSKREKTLTMGAAAPVVSGSGADV